MYFDQVTPVDGRIDLSGGDVGVSEEFLHVPKVGPTLQEVGREGMSQDVRAHLSLDAGRLRVLLETLEKSDARERPATLIEVDTRVNTPPGEVHTACREVASQCPRRRRTVGNQTLLASLSHDQ